MLEITADHFVAHRGWQLKYPENTLIGIQSAIEAGVVHIEFDIQFTGDGVPFLCHDLGLERLNGQELLLIDLTASQLKQYSCHEPERFGDTFLDYRFAPLKRLASIIKQYPYVEFYAELKRTAIRDHGLEFCLEHIAEILSALCNVTLISFDAEAVKKARDFGFEKTGLVLQSWQGAQDQIDATQADLVYISIKHLPGQGALNLGVPLIIYEIVDPDIARGLLQRGASKIESFDAPGLIAHFA